jgi:hypothetical protein
VHERLTCPSLPSRGRHDQPRAFTNRRQVSKFYAQRASIRLEPSRSCGTFEQTRVSTAGVEARSRPRSVSEPCVCPSARTDIDLEGITAWAHKKRTGPSLQAEGPVQLLHCRLERPKRLQHAHRRDFSDCSCCRPSRPATRSPGDCLGHKRSRHASDVPSPRARDGVGPISGTREYGR